ncbi:TolC family protein [candidate division KSB1 bacterium]|nr:TolC family protein [candidate division KSB1 bacterium]NIR69850.1 TolC family protein [candidate division KSB1 bacterium]NIS22970.1 TolC family protein [candidate division KSB1 bacterium]NIT69827.1 TolC family protein [candidate division KSB1 bacterium]NIU23501.1 TolC family protein [candidate division KSB1 bacterium]
MRIKHLGGLLLALIFCINPTFSQDEPPTSLSLDEAIDLALRQNEDMLIADNDAQNAGALLREAWADAFPEITFSSIYTRNFKQPVFFFPDPMTGEQRAFRIGSRNSYVFNLTVDQPLYQAGKISGGIKAAQVFKKFSNEGYQAVKTNVILSVKKAFYTVQLNQQLLEINQQSLEQQLAHLVNTRKLFREGQVSELDTLRAWVDYTNLQPQVFKAENNLRISENRLKELIGLDLEKPIELKDELEFEGTNGISLAELQEEALKKRPEFKQLEYQAQMLRHNIGVTRADLLPKLFFSGTYQSVAQSDKFDFGQGLQTSISGAVRLEVPIFNGFRDYARLQQAKLDFRNAEHKVNRFRDNLKIDVKSILLNVNEAAKRVQVQRHAIRQAERALFMAERRYNEGVGTQLEIGDALLALNVTKTNYVQAVYDHKVALAELDKAIGRE